MIYIKKRLEGYFVLLSWSWGVIIKYKKVVKVCVEKSQLECGWSRALRRQWTPVRSMRLLKVTNYYFLIKSYVRSLHRTSLILTSLAEYWPVQIHWGSNKLTRLASSPVPGHWLHLCLTRYGFSIHDFVHVD
jgi:hypothetical protein